MANNRLEELEKTVRFNDITAIQDRANRRHQLIIAEENGKRPASGVQTPNMPIEKIIETIKEGNYNVGHALTTRQIDIDFDTFNPHVARCFAFFLPPTPYRVGRATKPDGHWIYNIVEDFHSVRAEYEHIIKFLGHAYRLDGEPVKVEVRSRGHADNVFEQRAPEEHPYFLAPGSYHPKSLELITWSKDFRLDVTPVVYDARTIMKSLVLATVASFIVPHWGEGARQYMSMALAGALYRFANVRKTSMIDYASKSVAKMLKEGVDLEHGLEFSELDFEHLIEGICYLAGDDEVRDRLITFRQTWRKSEDADKKVTGITTLKKYLGADADYIQDSLFHLISGITSEINVQSLYERYFLWVGPGAVIDSYRIGNKNHYVFSRKQFTDSYADKFVTWKGVRVPLHKFIYQSGVINKVDGMDFLPPQHLGINDYAEKDEQHRFVEQDGLLYLNTFKGYATKPSAERVQENEMQPFISYVYDVLADGDAKKFEYLMAWMANLIQSPGKRPRTYMILVGEQGAGKSFLFEKFIVPILGRDSAATSDSLEDQTKWNSLLEGKTLVIFEEAINGNKRELANKIKHFVTADTITIKKKYEPEREVHNYCRPVFISNHEDDAVTLDATTKERRAIVLRASSVHIGDTDYWVRLAEFAQENIAKVHRFLLDYKYSDKTLGLVLDTEEKGRMQATSLLMEQPQVFWMLDRIREGYPLATQSHWFEAYNRDRELKANDIEIDRSEWPNLITETALQNDFRAWARAKGLGPRQLNIGRDKIFSALPTLKRYKRIKVSYVDRDAKVQVVQPRLVELPSMENIEKYLTNRYGSMITAELEDLGEGEGEEVDDLTVKRVMI